MSPDFIFTTGVAICGTSLLCAVIAAVILRFSKLRLNKQLDADYGKRRH